MAGGNVASVRATGEHRLAFTRRQHLCDDLYLIANHSFLARFSNREQHGVSVVQQLRTRGTLAVIQLQELFGCATLG